MVMQTLDGMWFTQADALICVRALTDPSVQVANTAARVLLHYYPLFDSVRGRSETLHSSYNGPPAGYYRMLHRGVVKMAEEVHRKDPKLITADDLVRIRSRKDPPANY